MNKKLDNYKIIFGLKILKHLLVNFIDVFLVLYFLTISNQNILPLGIYKLVGVITIYGVMVILRNYCKSKNRVILLRIGIILSFLYFLMVILLKEKIIDYIYLLGVLYGLEQGFYYSVYNIMESDGIENKSKTKYMGLYTVMKNLITILFPLVFGSIIQTSGFMYAIYLALFIVLLQIILSFLFQDKNVPKSNKVNFKEFRKHISNHKPFKVMMASKICTGLTYSEGALSYVITIYIIRIFSQSISLGIFTSIFSMISVIVGILFIKTIRPKYYNTLMCITSTITIIFLCIMVLNCNFITVVLLNLFQTISKSLIDIINEKNGLILSNMDGFKTEFKVEYFLSVETALFVGRIISNTLFILMAFTDSNFIMIIFIIFLIMKMISSIRLQQSVSQYEV